MADETTGYVLERRNDGWIVAGYEGDETELVIPSHVDDAPVILIASRAFEENPIIESVEVPETVTFVGNYAFASCPALKRAVIAGPITRLNLGVFWNCASLTDVTLPDTVTEVGDGAFRDCTSLTSISLPSSVTVIGDRAFSGCTSLRSFVAPENVETIMRSAFLNCTNLSTLAVRNSLNYVGPRAFQGCPQLKSVTILGDNIDKSLSAFFNNHSMSYLVADYAIQKRLVSFDDAKKLLKSELEPERVFGARVAASYPDRLGEIALKLSMVKALAQFGCIDELRLLADKPGFLTKMNVGKCIDVANEAGQTETAAYMLDLLAGFEDGSAAKGDDLRL